MRTTIATIACTLAFAFVLAGCAADGPDPVATQSDEMIGDIIGPIGGGQCGPRVCGPGTRCCNASCGVCTPPGAECTQQICSTTEAASMSEADVQSLIIIGGGQCGPNVCGPGSFCCNASCGTCAPRGGVCTQQICNPTE
jgi:hypothetical protein